MTRVATRWCGQSIERVEDGALLTGRGRFIDDLGIRSGTLHAAILRSSHAHAKIRTIDAAAARKAQGVAAVITGADVRAVSASLVAGVRAPIECWPIAVDRVRYVGEPVAVVLAASRYLAEDALELVNVGYAPSSILSLRSIRSTRRCTRASARTSRANARSVTATLSMPSRELRIAYR